MDAYDRLQQNLQNQSTTPDDTQVQPSAAPAMPQPDQGDAYDRMMKNIAGNKINDAVQQHQLQQPPVILPPANPEVQPGDADLAIKSYTPAIGGESFPTAPFTSDEQAGQEGAQLRQNNTTQKNVAAQTEMALGAKYDPNGLSLGQRTALGGAPNDATKQEQFMKMFPEGSFQPVTMADGSTNFKYQTSKGGPAALLTSGGVDAWNQYYQAMDPNIPATDRAQLLGKALLLTAANNTREIAEAAALSLVGGISGLLRGAATTIGTTVGIGAAADLPYRLQGLPSMPFSASSLTQSTSRDVVNGVFASLGLAAGAAVQGVGRLASGEGGGMFKLSQRGADTLSAIKRLQAWGASNGIDQATLQKLNAMPHQLLESEILQKNVGMASRLLSGIKKYTEGQKVGAEQLLSKSRDPADVESLYQHDGSIVRPERTGSLPDAVEQTTRDPWTGGVQNPQVEHVDAANMLDQDMSTVAQRTKGPVDAAYSKARAIEEPQFDAAPAVAAAAKAEKGVSTLTNYEKTPIFGTDKDAAGNPIQIQSNISKETSPISTPSPQLQSIIDRVKLWQANPPMPVARTLADGTVVTDSVADQVNALRQEAWDLSQAGPAGEIRQPEKLAKDVYGGLTQMMENTKNVNPAFQSAWKDASAQARTRFETLEDPIIKRGFKQSEGDQLSTSVGALRTMLNPNGSQVQNLQKLEKWSQDGTIRPETYQAVVQSAKTKLLSNPYDITKNLDTMDSAYKKQLFKGNNAELNDYYGIGDVYDKLKASGIQDSLENQTHAVRAVKDIIEKGNMSGNGNTFEQLRSMVQQNPDSTVGRDLRAGIIDNILRETTDIDRGDVTIQPGKFSEYLKNKLGDTSEGKLASLLNPQDMQHLQDLQRYIQTVGHNDKSTGASIAAYEQVGKLRELEHEAIAGLVESYGFGKLMTSPSWQKLMYGNGTFVPGGSNFIKRLGVIAGGLKGSSVGYNLENQTAKATGNDNGQQQ